MGREHGDAALHPLALAVADINWFTTASLFRELDDPSVSILALRCMDYLNGWRRGIYPWSTSCRPHRWAGNSLTCDLILPSGWMKRYPRLGMRPIARAIRGFWEQAGAGARRGLVLTYPHYQYLRDQLEPELSLYYNIDDYSLYWPRQAEEVRRLERRLVLALDATVCVARYRADELRASVPQAAGKIHHIPHGTPTAFLADQPHHRPAPAPGDIAHLPRPLLGYVGSIGHRVDWHLMQRLAESFPEASVVVIGAEPAFGSRHREPWVMTWKELAGRPNVHPVGWRSQANLPGYYRAMDVILIPYAVDDPFNRASSPTKIADGLGSTRPIVATAIPECRLYEHLFDVAGDHDAFLRAVGSLLARGGDDGRAGLRHDHARANTCAVVARRVLQVLDSCVVLPTEA
jgi:teichuronic acid biosynthesis glycosyltransferase TuaH